jgi:hypothetical protein
MTTDGYLKALPAVVNSRIIAEYQIEPCCLGNVLCPVLVNSLRQFESLTPRYGCLRMVRRSTELFRPSGGDMQLIDPCDELSRRE